MTAPVPAWRRRAHLLTLAETLALRFYQEGERTGSARRANGDARHLVALAYSAERLRRYADTVRASDPDLAALLAALALELTKP